MNRIARRLSLALTLLPLAACNSGDDSSGTSVGGSGGMSLLSCSLGCAASGSGPANCSISSIFVNQDIWLEFSQPVDVATVSSSSFSVVNATTGETPLGFYQLDPSNPRRVAFRPQLSFDSAGNPTFGLVAGQSYRVRVPAGGAGPVLTSVSGQANSTLLECFVQANLGVNDPVPGPPLVEVFLEQVVGGVVVSSEPAQGATEVPPNTRVRMVFDDIMNPATLVNPATGQSNFIGVAVDLNGDLADNTDQLDLSGQYTIAIDDIARTTTVTFTPSPAFPSSGTKVDPQTQEPVPRRIVVDLPPTILDLGGNSLANAGQTVFTTQSLSFPPTVLPGGTGEDFTTASRIDLPRTGAILDVADQGGGQLLGRVLPGFGGGSGRLGDLRIRSGEVVVLNTEASGSSFGPGVTTDFAAGNLKTFVIDNYDIGLGEEPGQVDITAENGLFEFASLVVDPGGVLRAVGEFPPRLLVRGEASVRGVLDLAGRAPAGSVVGTFQLPIGQHAADLGFGQTGGLPGPGGGQGGDGGDRQNTTGTPLAGSTGGFAHGVGVVVQTSGQPGEGRGGQPNAGGGGGGVQWPAVLPGPALTDLGTMLLTGLCLSTQVGAVGAGGTFATFGAPGTWGSPLTLFGVITAPPVASGGPEILRAFETDLDPEAGELVGGAGGGGGGTGVAGSQTNGAFFNCGVPLFGPILQLLAYRDGSGAGGGGGGGAVQIQAGRRLFVDGSIDLRGGGGGNAVPPLEVSGNTVHPPAMTAPGGGGSGGAALLQSLDLALASLAGVVDVTGGAGGVNPNGPAITAPQRNPSTGGPGGAGMMRLENSPLVPLSLANEAFKLLPANGGPGQPASADLVSVGSWAPAASGPSAQSGLQSCWLMPAGSVFDVDYQEDDLTDPLNPDLGWNMEIELPGGLVAPYRGPSFIQAIFGVDTETLLGTALGTAPILVRFQGARVVGALDAPCLDEPSDPEGPFLVGSLTPWVQHPAELNTYWESVFPDDLGLAATLKPNAIRYQIIFDRGAPQFGGVIQAVRSLSVRAQPD
ncbi:MAG: hypothetical protein GC161_03675 [Planctomycetaceae bacterium]|nr:hypothetical protein [Planctomycetaceae bacterium]